MNLEKKHEEKKNLDCRFIGHWQYSVSTISLCHAGVIFEVK